MFSLVLRFLKNLKSLIESVNWYKSLENDYTAIGNKADTDIYEIYYISKLQPILNGISNTGDRPTIVLPEHEFRQVIDVYTEKK